MKILFLDIDGVLNSDIWYNETRKQGLDLSKRENHLDPEAIKRLNRVIRQTKAKVVLSSSWRLKHPIQHIQTLLKDKGFIGEIIDQTPSLQNPQRSIIRGNEILQWCMDNEKLTGRKYKFYKQYAIIDDMDDMLLWQANNFYQTDRFCGLSATLCSKIIQHLNSF